MLNISLSSCVVLPPNPHLIGCAAVSIDSNSDTVWAINKDLVLLSVDVNKDGKKVLIVCDLKVAQDVSPGDSIVGMECLPETNTLAIATSNGELLSVSTIPPNEVEGVGCVSDGFLAMSWSPDQDVVVMVTGNNALLMMTREFDPVVEVSINSEGFGEAEPITVGWGKKETQFHGSLGKQSAKQPINDKVSPAVSWDDHTPLITWRGDGEFFACSTIDPVSGTRMFRVWRRDGVKLYSTSEPTQGLERPISWRPSGNLIACCQRKPQRYDVIFYEPNGLRHGEFTLSNDEHTQLMVMELQWNADSTVLGVWLDSKTTPKNTTIQLWTSKNYHWYLKQEFHPSPDQDPSHSAITTMTWDPIVPLKMHLLTDAGQYLSYTWTRSVSTSGYLDTSNNGAVAVIDGVNILWTPFRQVNVPPPMCAHQVTLPSSILAIAFAPPPHCNDFAALTSSGHVIFVKAEKDVEQLEKKTNGFRNITTSPVIQPGILKISPKDSHFNIHDIRWLLWIQENTLLGISSRSCDQSHDIFHDVIVEYSISNDTISEKCSTPCDGHVMCCHGNPNTGTVVMEFSDGSVYRYKDSSITPWMTDSGDHVTFGGVSCDQISLAKFSDRECVIGLNTTRRQLFIDNVKVSSSCTSFAIHNDFILLTTDTHVLRVLSTHSASSSLIDLNIDDTSVGDESLRRVERGSCIITVIPNDFRTLLQMPRGNLETICPRALVLARVRECLDNLVFKEAFLIMRRHRLNLNFICDHNLALFIKNARLFIEQIDDVSFINLFLTELKSEDVTTTMYPTPSWYGSQSPVVAKTGSNSSKVNLICDTLKPIFTKIDETKYSLSIITTHIKKVPQELEEVLLVIKKLRDSSPQECAVSADDAMKYALLMVDVNDLYDVALGMYDFDLVIMVAQRSQKDPKEYLPFLNELKKLPEMYRKYRIDHYLKRYEKALHSISQCGSDKFDECLSLIKDHKLYKQALKLYQDKESHDRYVISMFYADYLRENASNKEAAIIYEGCKELESALVCYDKADMWQQVLTMSARIGHDKARTHEIVSRIIVKLKSKDRYSDAARVLIEYEKDTMEAVKVLIEGKEWAEAIRLIHFYGHLELIDTCLKPGLLDAYQTQLSSIEQQSITFNRHVDRLRVVRKVKAEKAAAILDGTFVADERDADLFSDLTSVTGISSIASSRLSKISNKTAKSRKKAERKKYSLKEGSAHEDIALVEALKQITELSNNLREEIGNLLLTLSVFQYEAEASELQESYAAFIDTVNSHHKEIWPPPSNSTGATLDTSNLVTGPSSTVNDIVTALKTQQTALTNHSNVLAAPVLSKDESWKLKVL